jgi:hypothetical protein
MIAAAGHTLQLAEQEERDRHTGLRVTRISLECTCGACFVSEWAVRPTMVERARIRAKGWDISQAHLQEAAGGKAGK